jgi:DNA polymerase III epsilon subunit-like protein
MKVTLKRGQVGKSDGVDVTVKSATGLGVAFAPTWEMVSGHKGGTMGDIEYKHLYTEILETAGDKAFQKLWEAGTSNGSKLTVLCYCPSGKFCHTHLLVEHAVKRYPQWFIDGRRARGTAKGKGSRMKYLLAVDLETTGLRPDFHEITQIGAILMDKNLNELGSFETLVRIEHPERGIEGSFNVFEYTGINPGDLQHAPHLKDTLRSLETFVRSKTGDMELKKVIMFGQNPTFDKGFLEAAFVRQGWKFPFDFHVLALESMFVYHHLLKTGELPNDIGLKDICKVAGVENKQKHNAMSDIRATVDALHKLCPKKSPTKKSKATMSEADCEACEVGIVEAAIGGQSPFDFEEPIKPVPRRRNVKAK